MKTREMGYDDYNIAPEEKDRLMKLCQKPDPQIFMILCECAIEANPDIAADLVYSIKHEASYERMCGLDYIPIGKSDFYGYRRKTLAIFRDMMKLFLE